MTDASGAKWRHVNLCEEDNKSQLQPAALKHRKAPRKVKSKRQDQSDQSGAPCAAGCPVFFELCVVSVQLGLSDNRTPMCTPLSLSRWGGGEGWATPVLKISPLGLWLILRSCNRGRDASRKLPLDLNYYWLRV